MQVLERCLNTCIVGYAGACFMFCEQMYLEGSRVVIASNETALKYFQKAADKVETDLQLCINQFYFWACSLFLNDHTLFSCS